MATLLWFVLAFGFGLIAGAVGLVVLILAGFGGFMLLRAYQAQRLTQAMQARVMAAIAKEQPLQPTAFAFPFLPRNRMD